MQITSIQKIIKIGSSAGVTIPTKELKKYGLKPGSSVEVSIKPTELQTTKISAEDTAKELLKTYEQDFKNLSQR